MQRIMGVFILLALWAGILSGVPAGLDAGLSTSNSGNVQPSEARAQAAPNIPLYLPVIFQTHVPANPFGVESHSPFTNLSTLNSTVDLGVTNARLGVRIKWLELQPDAGGAIQWGVLATVEQELRLLKSKDIQPVMVITDSPLWALKVIEDDKGWCDFELDGILEPCSIDEDGKDGGDGKSYCGQIDLPYLDDFGAFMYQLVARYSAPEYGVKIWELGNEPDVDPSYVPGDSGYGCWGDDAVANYNGAYYGQMLTAVTPMIKAADPQAQVWIGGLLLSSPLDSASSNRFLEGILTAGAAPYFDAVPYHWYAWYDPYNDQVTPRRDYDLTWDKDWKLLGGGSLGKAVFLTQKLAAYGVTKPLVMNEVALGCSERWAPVGSCIPALSDGFLQAQADFIPRAVMRAMKGAVQKVYWFTLEENGWGWVGLLDINRQPKPVYYAYRNLVAQFQHGTFQGQIFSYGTSIEAYQVKRADGRRMQVLWTIDDITLTVQVPESELVAAYSRDGETIKLPAPSGGPYTINVGFSPIYLILTP